MSDNVTVDGAHPRPEPIDLAGVDRSHREGESIDHLLGTTVAETALGVTGVHSLGGAAARGLDRASRSVLGTSTTPGVTITHDAPTGTTTVDIDLTVDYPHVITRVSDEVRRQVDRAAGQILGSGALIVVNVNVADVNSAAD